MQGDDPCYNEYFCDGSGGPPSWRMGDRSSRLRQLRRPRQLLRLQHRRRSQRNTDSDCYRYRYAYGHSYSYSHVYAYAHADSETHTYTKV